MSTSIDIAKTLHRVIFAGEEEKYLALFEESQASELRKLMECPYGAYLCQDAADPRLHETFTLNLYTIQVFMTLLANTEKQITNNKMFHPEVVEGVALYIMSNTHKRLTEFNTTTVVMSLMKYYLTILKIRQIHYDMDTEGKNVNVDWVPDESPYNTLYWENLSERDRAALEYVGLDMFVTLEDTTPDFVRASDIPGRLSQLSALPRYRSYYNFIYAKSDRRLLSSMGWLISKAKKIASKCVDLGYDVDSVEELKRAIGKYAPSMRTSTTGATLESKYCVYMPKQVEGVRLLSNLFLHHLRHVLEDRHAGLLNECDKLAKMPDNEDKHAAKRGGSGR